MSLTHTDVLAAGAAVLAVWMCGVGRVGLQVIGLALQTALLAGVCVLPNGHTESHGLLVVAGAVLLVKAVGIPLFLSWCGRRLEAPSDSGVERPSSVPLFVACAVLAIGYLMAGRIAAPLGGSVGAAGVALSLVLMGMLLMVTRRAALSQVIGFLVLENGIFLYGLTQTRGLPLLLELGVVFEVLVAVMLAGLVIQELEHSFEHTDVTQLRGLRH